MVTVWGPLPWSRHPNTTLNHDKVSICCSLLSPQWKQSLRSTSVEVGDTWSLKCSIERLDRQNKICANLDHHWSKKCSFLYMQTKWVCPSGTQRFCKNDIVNVIFTKSLIVNDSSHSVKTWLESLLISKWLESMTRVTLSLLWTAEMITIRIAGWISGRIVSLQPDTDIQNLLWNWNRIRICETLLLIFRGFRLLEKVAHCTIIHLVSSFRSIFSAICAMTPSLSMVYSLYHSLISFPS